MHYFWRLSIGFLLVFVTVFLCVNLLPVALVPHYDESQVGQLVRDATFPPIRIMTHERNVAVANECKKRIVQNLGVVPEAVSLSVAPFTPPVEGLYKKNTNFFTTCEALCNTQLPYVLMFEEDCHFSSGNRKYFVDQMKWALANLEKWDIVYFGSVSTALPYPVYRTVHRTMSQGEVTAHMMLVKEKVWRDYVAKIRSHDARALTLPFDMYLSQNSEVRQYHGFPAYAYQSPAPEAIRRVLGNKSDGFKLFRAAEISWTIVFSLICSAVVLLAAVVIWWGVYNFGRSNMSDEEKQPKGSQQKK